MGDNAATQRKEPGVLMTAATLGSWRNPPLAYVVAELVISPHYSIGSALPQIQGKLRDDYPRTIEGTEIMVSPGAVQPQPSRIWRLMSADQARGVHVATRAISLHVTSYVNSADYLERWAGVLAAIEESNLAPFIERAGLRYIDLLVPSADRSTQDYLCAELQGVKTPPEGSVQHRVWSANIAVDGIAIQMTTASPAPPGEVLPQNLQALPLRKPAVLDRAEQAHRSGQRTGFIDVDCSMAVQAVFNSETLVALYRSLHAKTSETFNLLISDTAAKEWK